MSNLIYVLALLSAVLLAIGQLLFKIGSSKIEEESASGFIMAAITSPILIFSVALYGFTILIWIYALNKMPLSIAYPITGLAYVIVPALSYYFLGEKISPSIMIGSFLILVGISLIARSSV
tara:strand:+ start:321 stop:683 length:363 start_codon:yes stop_codon:yes gene_type:complete